MAKRLGGLFLLSVAIGVVSGVVAWLFRLLIGIIHNVAFYGQWSLEYNANQHTTASPWGALIILAPVLGGLVVVWLVKNFAPEAKGHGVPEVISSIYHNEGLIRGIVSLVKALASAITIGSGGSLGREGPIVQICSAFSSATGQWFGLPTNQRIILIACGASAGIAATFNAPLAGILFAIELLLVSINSKTILPVAIATVIAANIGRILIGPQPSFDVPALHSADAISSPMLLALYFPFGLLMGLAALLFVKSIYWAEDWFDRLPVNDYIRHVLGTLSLGIIFYCFFRLSGHYYVQGVGYATIEDILSGALSSPWFILLLFASKLLATCLTIGSGGSGGVFSPSLFLGAALGGSIGNLLALMMPDMGIDPAAFAVAGMASIVAAATSAPLTAVIITYEMTLDYSVILPVMISVSIAYAVRRYFSEGDIYTLKLLRRGQLVPEGLAVDISSHQMLKDIMDHDLSFVEKGRSLSSLDKTACILENDRVIGIVEAIRYPVELEISLEQTMRVDFAVLRPHMTVKHALQELGEKQTDIAIISQTGGLEREAVVGFIDARLLTQAFARGSKFHFH